MPIYTIIYKQKLSTVGAVTNFVTRIKNRYELEIELPRKPGVRQALEIVEKHNKILFAFKWSDYEIIDIY